MNGPATAGQELDSFVRALAATRLAVSAYNQYGGDHPANRIRRQNLRLYLGQMACLRPDVLLIGEAPGYRGGRLTGVPFTSEHLLLNGSGRQGLLGQQRGYRQTTEQLRIVKEASATIVWQAIARDDPPLLWNAFPFHPHRPGNPMSNRPPNAAELALGRPFVAWLLRLFDIGTVVAVGNKADASLRRLGLTCHKVRHPSRGGKAEFRRGLALYLGERPPL